MGPRVVMILVTGWEIICYGMLYGHPVWKCTLIYYAGMLLFVSVHMYFHHASLILVKQEVTKIFNKIAIQKQLRCQ